MVKTHHSTMLWQTYQQKNIWPIYPIIYLSTFLSSYPICPSTHLPIYPSIYPSTYILISINQSINLYLSIYPSIDVRYLSLNQPIYQTSTYVAILFLSLSIWSPLGEPGSWGWREGQRAGGGANATSDAPYWKSGVDGEIYIIRYC